MKTKGPKQDSQSRLWSQVSLVWLQRGCKPCGYVNLIYWAGKTDSSEAAILTFESFKGCTVRLSSYFFLLLFNCSVNNVCINIIKPYPKCNGVKSVYLQCGGSWVRSPVGSKKDTYAIYMCCIFAKYTALRRNISWLGTRIMCPHWFPETTVYVKTYRPTRKYPTSDSTSLCSYSWMMCTYRRSSKCKYLVWLETMIYHTRDEETKFYTGWKGLISHIYNVLDLCALLVLLAFIWSR